MSADYWVFENISHDGPVSYMAKRGACVLEVWRDPLKAGDGTWYAGAGFSAPESVGGEQIWLSDDTRYANRELAELAALKLLTEFIEKIHADFNGTKDV